MQEHFPERFQGSERGEPLFRYRDGSPVRREHVQKLFQLAACGVGDDPFEMGSHSLRIGPWKILSA